MLVRAISLWQPWATLWLLTDPDEKIFETRHWGTSYRGPLLVHAAKKRDGEVREYLKSRALRRTLERHSLSVDQLAFGAIIGSVNLIDCCATEFVEPSRSASEEDLWGDWSDGRFAWGRAPKPKLFARPIPYRGQQGFFGVDDRVLQEAA